MDIDLNAFRPYSQDELADIRARVIQRLFLSDIFAEHERCGHRYSVKKNSRKARAITDTQNPDSGNCSVCWARRDASEDVGALVTDYTTYFREEPQYLTYDLVCLEEDFYTWLYPKRPHRERQITAA